MTTKEATRCAGCRPSRGGAAVRVEERGTAVREREKDAEEREREGGAINDSGLGLVW